MEADLFKSIDIELRLEVSDIELLFEGKEITHIIDWDEIANQFDDDQRLEISIKLPKICSDCFKLEKNYIKIGGSQNENSRCGC